MCAPDHDGYRRFEDLQGQLQPCENEIPPVAGVAAHGREIESGGQASISAKNYRNPVPGHGELERLRQGRQKLFGEGIDLAVVDLNGDDRTSFLEQHV